MQTTERYLKQATRGLWGQKKRDAMTELRGAIEDKIWRHQVSGLSGLDAERAALRDLGSPTALARELTRVHTGPQVARMTVLLGLVGLLGFQALAKVNVVHAAPDPRWTVNCRYDEAYLTSLLPKAAEAARQQLAQPGGRERLISKCRSDAAASIGNQLLKLGDVWTAFRKGGVTVQQLPGSAGLYNVTFPGSDSLRLLDLGQSVQFISGEKYVDLAMLIEVLANRTDAPLHLTGVVNPTLGVGPVTLHLGTSAAPVRASDVAIAAVHSASELNTLDSTLSVMLPFPDDLARSFAFRAAVPDGSQYAILDNMGLNRPAHYWLLIGVAQGGRVLTGVDPELAGLGVPVMVSTLAELKAATAAGRRALLVYCLNTRDLRHVLGDPLRATPLSRPEAAGAK